MNIDPFGWLLTLPMLMLMVWFYLQPSAHPVKRIWRESLDREALGWGRLGFESPAASSGPALFWSLMAALTAVTMLSLASYAGVL